MSKHTESLWKVHPTDSTVIIDKYGADIAVVSGDYENNYEEMEAAARFIAAAPDLLEALKDALEYLQHHLPDVTLAPHRAAIAKAEGHT